jgi:hypothetical protein
MEVKEKVVEMEVQEHGKKLSPETKRTMLPGF